MIGARYLSLCLRSTRPLASDLFRLDRIRSPQRLLSTTTSKGQGRRRIRVISCDVTGTFVSFLGRIEEHYGNAAQSCGVELPPEKISMIGSCFNQAYHETSNVYPCFGGAEISAKDWWRRCVERNFELVGTTMTSNQKDRVFQRVYSKFGSHDAYGAFPDAIPFLKWCSRRGIVTGVISNADERYGDSILPMLGLGDDMDFLTFSKNVGFEKPAKDIFQEAMKQAEPWLPGEESPNPPLALAPKELLPEEVLHIGNDFEKDYLGAKNAGFHAVLLDRYNEHALADSWRQKGAPVCTDLLDVVEYLGREQLLPPK